MAQPGGREPFGAPLGVAPQLQPLQGMLLRRSTDIHPKELARDMRAFFNSLLGLLCSSQCDSNQQSAADSNGVFDEGGGAVTAEGRREPRAEGAPP